jgi:hypothetical protein
MYDIYGMNANYLWRLLCIREFGLQSDVYEYRRDLDWKTYYFEKKALQKDGTHRSFQFGFSQLTFRLLQLGASE